MRRLSAALAAALAVALAALPTACPAADAAAGGPEPVIGLSYRGAYRAYPLQLFADRRVVNDVVGSMEIAVFHDPERSVSAAWFRTVAGEPIEFAETATENVAEDLTTVTRWDLTTGAAVAGNLVGQRLVAVPFTLTTWAEWLAAHPKAAYYRTPGAAEGR